MTVAIIDYGMGNLGSVRRALAELSVPAIIAETPDQLDAAERIILPGVGSFADGMQQLQARGWVDALRQHTLQRHTPLLGICLGMQLLATHGQEGGETAGLDLIPGEVVRLDGLGCGLRIPHTGWNSVSVVASAAVFAGIPNGTDFYFVHSFAFRPQSPEPITATADYGASVVAALNRGRIFGTQFHPEKSSRPGLRLLKNFTEFPAC